MMKIAFTGSSGSGKTTLVEYLSKEVPIPHLIGSSGELMNDEDREYLKEMYGYEGGQGHRHVIKESHKNPDFGLAHQTIVLRRRIELIQTGQDFVTDRSPLDNFVYFMLQTGLYQNVEACKAFMDSCIKATSFLTHLIYVPAMLHDIENNHSRVDNFYYQKAVDAIFNTYWSPFIHHARLQNPKLKVMKIVDLELDKRKANVLAFVKNY